MAKKYKQSPTYFELVNEFNIDGKDPVGSLEALEKYWEEMGKNFNH